jgi:hypothetical protein
MICPCPKCDARTELDLSHIPEEGTSAKCPECKTRFWISKESFARRAVKKEGKALCYYCNNELNDYLDCPTCGVMYPDYCIVQTAKPVKRKKRKSSSAISFSLRTQRRTRSSFATQQTTERASKSVLVAVALLAVVLVLAVAGGIAYSHNKSEKQYTAGYFRALMGIKLGTDLNLRQCAAISATAKAKMAAGQAFDLRSSDRDKAKIAVARNDVDLLMKEIPAPPQKFIKANESLTRLYGVYAKSYALVDAPAGSLQSFSDSAGKVDGEFKQAAQELKAGLPAELAAAYQNALPKYPALRDL